MSENHKKMGEKFTAALVDFEAVLNSIDVETEWSNDPPEWWLSLDRLRREILNYRRARSTP